MKLYCCGCASKTFIVSLTNQNKSVEWIYYYIYIYGRITWTIDGIFTEKYFIIRERERDLFNNYQ